MLVLNSFKDRPKINKTSKTLFMYYRTNARCFCKALPTSSSSTKRQRRCICGVYERNGTNYEISSCVPKKLLQFFLLIHCSNTTRKYYVKLLSLFLELIMKENKNVSVYVDQSYFIFKSIDFLL